MIYDDKKFIGSIVRNARKKAKLNQANLSEKLGMSEKNLGNIENGRQFPQVNNFLRIIEVLHLTLEDFGVTNTKPNISDSRNDLIAKILSCPNNKLKSYAKVLKLVDDIFSCK